MPFGGTANPDSFSLPSGGTQDVIFPFTDVPADETITETFAFGVQQFVQTVTLLAGDPTSVSFDVPATVTRELVSIDDTQAVVRYTRA